MAENVERPKPAPETSPHPRFFRFTATSAKTATRAFDAAGTINVILRDTEARGLILKKQRRDWVVALERKVRGRIWRVTLGPYDPVNFNVAAARAEVARILGNIIAGTYSPDAERTGELGKGEGLARMTVQDAVDLHARVNPELRASTIRSYNFGVRCLTEGNSVRMAAVSTDYLRSAYARLCESHSPATANQMLRSVKALWNTWAEEHPEGTAPTRNPVSAITSKKRGRMKKAPPRTGALAPAQRRPWFDGVQAEFECRGPTGTAFAALSLLFLTGLRANEVLAMPWSEVGEDSITIGAPRMKAGEPLSRPITVAMRRVFRHQLTFHPRSPWVFPARSGDGPMGDLRKALWPLNESVLGNPRAIIPHDLRRTYIATAALAGVPPIATKMLVGHATTDVTEEYSRALRSELPDIAARIEAELLREVAS